MNSKLPKGWKIAKLSEVLETLENGNRPRGGIKEIDEGIPSIGGEHLNSEGGFNFEKLKLVPSDFYHSLKKGKIKKRDVLVVKDGATTGKTSFVGNEFTYEKSAVNEHVFILRGREELVDQKFLFYHLYSPIGQRQIDSSFHGSAVGGINKQFVKTYSLVLPPLELQEKIVSILDKAGQLMLWRKEADKLTEDYLSSVFLEMFGDPVSNPKKWDVVRINDVVEYSQYGTSLKSNSSRQGYPIIGMGNITNEGQLDLSKISYVQLPTDEFEKLKLNKGDVIFNRTNSTELIGKTTYWNLDFNAVLASYLVKLKLKENTNPVFFTFLLNTQYFKKLFARRCKKAVNQSNISPTLLKKFKMYLPPITIQNQFETIVREVEITKTYQKQSKKSIANLFYSLQQKAFEGELSC